MVAKNNEYSQCQPELCYYLQTDNRSKYDEGNTKIIWLGIRNKIDADHLRLHGAEQK